MGSFGSPFFTPLCDASAQKLAKHADALVDVLLQQQERRQKAHNCVLCTVEEDALRESLLDDGTSWNLQVDALDESATADFFRGGIVVNQLLKFVLKVGADLGDILQQFFFFDNRKIFKGDAA